MMSQRERTFILGEDANTLRIARNLERSAGSQYEIVGQMDFNGSDWSRGGVNSRCARLERILRSGSLQTLLASASSLNGSLEYLDGLCRAYHVRLQIFSSGLLSKTLLQRVDNIDGIPLVSPRNTGTRPSVLVKRVFDLTATAILVFFLLPLCLIVALVIKLESRGPVFFRHQRHLTSSDHPFSMYKFRSMYHMVDEAKESLKSQECKPLFKEKNDPRVTRVGKVMRRFSIDEIPQLLNVLKGEMSLVGPRPLPAEDLQLVPGHEEFTSLCQLRSRARPGMTGLWQVSGRSTLDFREMLLLDLQYIEHQNLLLDLKILARTLPAVLMGEGAY